MAARLRCAVLLLASLLVMAVPSECQTFSCTDECCYWYTTVPKSAACSIDDPQQSVTVHCTVLTRHDPLTNVTVRWYWSGDPETAGVRGTQLTNYSTKYLLQYNPAVTSLNGDTSPNALFRDSYPLTIFNFNTTDFGYYWCQIAVNGSCLFPSPYGHISENITAFACSRTAFREEAVQAICAGSDTSPDNCSETAPTNTTETTMPTTNINSTATVTTAPTTDLPTSSTSVTTMPNAMPGSDLCRGDITEDVKCIGVIGGSAGGFFLLVLVTAVCIGVCVCVRRRRRRRKPKHENGKHREEETMDIELHNTPTSAAPNETMSVETNNRASIATSQHELVAVTVETPNSVTTTANTTIESHTYDTVNLEPAHSTSRPLSDPIASHTYEPTPGTLSTGPARAKSPQPPSGGGGLSSSVEYDMIDDRERGGEGKKGGAHLYSGIEENTKTIKEVNHGEKGAAGKNVLKHQYDQVITNQDTSKGTNVEAAAIVTTVNPHFQEEAASSGAPMYHTLEDSSQEQPMVYDDEYSAPQPHKLVMPANPVDNTSPEGRGVVEAVDNKAGTITAQQNTTQLVALDAEDPEPQYDEPFSNPGQPYLVPAVSSTNPPPPSSKSLFDDPSYDKGYPDPSKAPALPKATVPSSSGANGIPDPPPRVESSQSDKLGVPRFNNYEEATELIKTPPTISSNSAAAVTTTGSGSLTASNSSRRERDYETTDLVKCEGKGGEKTVLSGLFDDPSYGTAGFAGNK